VDSRAGKTALLVLAALYAAWSALYVWRTSFVAGELRVFCLWDDAMISMRYAQHLAEGRGLLWNPGEEPVQGMSNLGLTLLMAGLHRLPLDPLRLSLPLQLLNLAGLVFVLLRLARVARELWHDDWIAGVTAVSLALCAPLAVWGLQGADTTAVAVWLTLAVGWLARAGPVWPRGLFAFVAAGVVLRLDCAIFAPCFLAASLLYPGPARRRALAGAAWLAGALAAVLGFGALYYGDPLPNTFYLKATGAPLRLVLGSGWAQLVAWAGLLPALFLGAIAAPRGRHRPPILVCAGLVVTALLYHLWVGGDWLVPYGSRFVTPVLPFLLLLCAAGCRALFAMWLPAGVLGRAPVAAGLGALALLPAFLTNPEVAANEWLVPGAPTMLREVNARHVHIALYLREHAEPGTTVAAHWAGVVPYFSRLPTVDVLGKSDRHIARLAVDRFAPGHSKWDWDYVLGERRPDLFLDVSRGLEERPDFRESYWRAETRDGLAFWLRRSSAARIHDPDLVLAEVSAPAPPRPGAARAAGAHE
jgi:hypothetical protein